jgi:hypothetical protein
VYGGHEVKGISQVRPFQIGIVNRFDTFSTRTISRRA